MKHLAATFLTLATLTLPTLPTLAQTRFTIQVEGKPDAPDILLLPGLTSGKQVFDAEAKILAPTNRLYRFQLDGFAGQPAGPNATGDILKPVVEELHQYIAAQKIHPYVIGHSMGGLLGLMLAQAHPEDVRSLLIVDSLPFYALVFSPQATVAAIEPQAKTIRDALIAAPDAPYAANAQKTATYLVNNPEAQKLVASESIASNRHVMAESMYEDMTTDLRPNLATIKTHTVLLYPYDPTLQGPDPKKTDDLYHDAYATMPNITLHRIDASRHFIQLDQPAAFNDQVQLFLK